MEFSAKATQSAFYPLLWEIHSAPYLVGTDNFICKKGNHNAQVTAYTCLLLQSRMNSASFLVMVGRKTSNDLFVT